MSLWDDLHAHRAARQPTIASLCSDPQRFKAFSAEADGLFLDYAKTSIDDTALALLLRLAAETGLEKRRDAMLRGEMINETEGRAVLHTALRRPARGVFVGDEDVMPGVLDTLQRMKSFAAKIRSGEIAGEGGKFTDIVNIGIGGSDLGPVMATLALAPCHDGPRTHFVSNVDGAHIHDTLKGLDPARTLVIVASKTFTTIETMTNAITALDWMKATLRNPGDHFAALSSAAEKTAEFGIDPSRVFGFEDWVGGRYSIWGPIGLSLMIAVGPEDFQEFLSGGHAMDVHFADAPFARNLPVILALIGIWHRNICGYPSRAVLPYDQRLLRLPAYLQQLDMESNGKSVGLDGKPVSRPTGPIVWGEPGTNGQHAFYQLIHQGTDVVPCEFMIAAEGHEPELAHHHALLVANCLAQSEALMVGRGMDIARQIAAMKGFEGAELERQARQRVFPGNRPSTTLVYRKLTPFVLGQIVALYEHRVFCEGAIWGLNSFDQWGVELGKELATALGPRVATGDGSGKDASTAGLLAKLKSLRQPKT